MAENKEDKDKKPETPDEDLPAEGPILVDEKTGEVLPKDKPHEEKEKPEDEDEDEAKDDKPPEPEGESDDEKRERRRQEKHDRRDRQKAAREAKDREVRDLKRANAEYAARLQALERRSHSSELAQVDAAIRAHESNADIARRAMADAMTAQDADTYDKALKSWYESQRMAEGLKANKQHFEAAQRKDSERRQQDERDPVVARQADQWVARNAWYDADPNTDDEDSVIAKSVSEAVARKLDPRQEGYWKELDRRLKTALPHRYRTKRDDPAGDDDVEDEVRNEQPRPQTTTGSGRDASGPKKGFQLSRERVEAMREAGVWDDEAARKKQIAAYIKYDREHATEARR